MVLQREIQEGLKGVWGCMSQVKCIETGKPQYNDTSFGYHELYIRYILPVTCLQYLGHGVELHHGVSKGVSVGTQVRHKAEHGAVEGAIDLFQ